MDEVVAQHSFTERELATILAGLRLLQEQDLRHVEQSLWDIVSNMSSLQPLEKDDIEMLCQRLAL